MSYLLYWHPLTSSFGPHLVLEELGVPYTLKLVDYDRGEHTSQEFLQINPNGMLPVLALPDGEIAYESAAIVAYLVERHPEAGLAPPAASSDRAFFYQWLFYMSSMVFQTYTRYFQSDFFSTRASEVSGIRERALQDLEKRWQILDRALEGRAWLLGDRASACDLYLHMMTRWHAPQSAIEPDSPTLADAFFDRFPNVLRVSQTVAERPAVAKIAKLYPRQDYFAAVG